MATLPGDVDLYYEVHGRGRPLLLIAGLAADCAYWLPALDALASRCQVIVVDNRGAGRTTPMEAAISIHAMADDCMALVRHLQLPAVSVVGHSMGGMIGQACAVRHPALVTNLVLVATAATNSARNNDLFASWSRLLDTDVDRALWFRNLFYWVFSAQLFADSKAIDAAVQFAATYPYQQSALAFRHQIAAIAAFDGAAALPAIHARTLVMAGTEDLLFPLSTGAALAQAIANAKFAPIKGVAHSIPVEFPQEFVRRVLEFVLDQEPVNDESSHRGRTANA